MANLGNGEKIYRSVGKFLRRKLKENNMTQAQLAMELFVGERTLQRWINSEIHSVDPALIVAKFFGVSVQEVLFSDEDNPDYPDIAA